MISSTLITSFDTLPVVLTMDEIVALYRLGRSTLRKQLTAGTFRPAPFARDPYRWLKVDVQRYLERQATTPSPLVRSARGRKKRVA